MRQGVRIVVMVVLLLLLLLSARLVMVMMLLLLLLVLLLLSDQVSAQIATDHFIRRSQRAWNQSTRSANYLKRKINK